MIYFVLGDRSQERVKITHISFDKLRISGEKWVPPVDSAANLLHIYEWMREWERNGKIIIFTASLKLESQWSVRVCMFLLSKPAFLFLFYFGLGHFHSLICRSRALALSLCRPLCIYAELLNGIELFITPSTTTMTMAMHVVITWRCLSWWETLTIAN